MFDNPYFNIFYQSQPYNFTSPYGNVISADVKQYTPGPFTAEDIAPSGKIDLNTGGTRQRLLTRDQRANVYSQAITGGLQLASDVATIANQPLGLGQAPSPFYMEGFDPTYQTGEYAARAFGATPKGASAEEILGTAAKAAGTGASIGTTIGGPVGTLIGAGVGAVAGALSAGIGGGVRKRRQTRERQRALSQVESQQEQFNRAQAAFNEQQAAQYGYQQRRNRRMQNLFI